MMLFSLPATFKASSGNGYGAISKRLRRSPERATAVLLRWVNAAPFELVPRLDRPTDKYGRDLMVVRRMVRRRSETAAEVLIEARDARAHLGEARTGWC